MGRDLGLFLVLITAGAVVAYNWFDPSYLAIFGGRGAVNIEPPPVAVAILKAEEKKAALKKMSSTRVESRVDATPPGNQVTSASVAVPSPPAQQTLASICCARADLPFPTPESLRKGATTREIRAEYGTPTIDITGTRDGRVLERYYYMNREQTRLTIANLENGLLTSAESLSSPYFRLPGPGGPQNGAKTTVPQQ